MNTTEAREQLTELGKLGVHANVREAFELERPRPSLKNTWTIFRAVVNTDEECRYGAKILANVSREDIENAPQPEKILFNTAKRIKLEKYYHSAMRMYQEFGWMQEAMQGMWMDTMRVLYHFDGGVILRPTVELTAALKQTSLDVKMRDIKIPWIFFLMEWPINTFCEAVPKVTAVVREDFQTFQCGITVSRKSEDGGWRNEILHLRVPLDTDETIQSRIDDMPIDDGMMPLDDRDKKIMTEVVSAVMGTIIYASSESDHVTNLTRSITGDTKPAKGERMVQFISIGDKFGKSYREAIRNHKYSVDDRHSPIPHWRRGHFKSVAHGAGHSERKIMWIRPTFVAVEKDKK